MTWSWRPEKYGHRIPFVAYVGESSGKWWHVSFYDSAADLWRRQPGVYAKAPEAMLAAEAMLEADGRKPSDSCPHGAARLLAQAAELIREAESLLSGHVAQSSAEFALAAVAEAQSEL